MEFLNTKIHLFLFYRCYNLQTTHQLLLPTLLLLHLLKQFLQQNIEQSQMDQQVVKRSKLVNLAAEEARLQQKLKTAQASQQTRSSNASETAELKKAEHAYKPLTNAYRQYNQARKNGDQAQQAYWSQSAQSALNELNLLEQKLPS